MPRTSIVGTLGPASWAPDTLRALVEAGLRVARINCSHGTPEEHAQSVQTVRQVSKETGIPVAVLYDLSGPKIRTGDLDAPIPLTAGEEFTLTARPDRAPDEVPLGFTDLPRFVSPGCHIIFDDGALEAEVLATTETDIRCRALITGPLGSHKGINLPGVSLPIPAVTEKDLADLRHGLEHGADWIAMSFVRSADDFLPVRAVMAEMGIVRPIIAKIEKHEAITNLEAIVEAADGIMVARGDLGVEVSLERIPLLQKQIIRVANKAGKPVITATQMLDSMIRNPRPTRAEVTDVANAILDGTDAVMLSGETSVGNYPIETVRTMASVAEWAETLLPEDVVPANEAPHYDTPTGALAAAAVDIAGHLKARAIVAVTEHGQTATLVSKSRPHQPIFAITANPETATQLPLLWGVTPMLVAESESQDEIVDRGVRNACGRGLVADGDLLVIVSVNAQPVGVVTRATESLRLAHVRQRGCGK
jgi:pyruvate kinase